MTIFGVGILGYGFLSSSGSQNAKAQTTTTHTNTNSPQASQTMTGSPGGVQIRGDNNTVNQGPNDRRIRKEKEFTEALRALGSMAIRLEGFQDRETLFLYRQLNELFVESGWSTGERGTVNGGSWVGVYVVIRESESPPPAAVELLKQLRANGIASILVPEKNPDFFSGVAFVVRVGLQPQSNKK